MEETVHARGHEAVQATHASTFEVTCDEYLTPAGDCILAVGANRSPADFDPSFVTACRDASASISLTLKAGEFGDTVTGRGHPDLTFASQRSLVGRTSTYVDDRTVLVAADKAATDIDRALVDALAGGTELRVSIRVR